MYHLILWVVKGVEPATARRPMASWPRAIRRPRSELNFAAFASDSRVNYQQTKRFGEYEYVFSGNDLTLCLCDCHEIYAMAHMIVGIA